MVVFRSKTCFHYKCPLFLLCENNSKRFDFQVASNHCQINQKTCWFLISMLHKCGFTSSSYASEWRLKPLLSTAPPGGTKPTLLLMKYQVAGLLFSEFGVFTSQNWRPKTKNWLHYFRCRTVTAAEQVNGPLPSKRNPAVGNITLVFLCPVCIICNH